MDTAGVERTWSAVWDGLEACYNPCRRSIFEPRARDLVTRARIEEGARVLDLGTGTGLAAFLALERVGREGRVVGADSAQGLLRAARGEAARRGIDKLELVRTSMTRLALPDEAFDHVIGNYSFCCSPRYTTTLQEAYRVLRPGGRVTYNHEGPHLHPVATVFKELLGEYRLGDPPDDLRRTREAITEVEDGWAAYKDPFTTTAALRTTGFREVTATLSHERPSFRTLEQYLDYRLTGSMEFGALPPARQRAFRNVLRKALRPHLTDAGLVLEQDVLTFQGSR